MSSVLLAAGWLTLLAVTIWWLATRLEPAGGSLAPEAGPAGDPHAGEVAAFRRELHDWDRRRGTGT